MARTLNKHPVTGADILYFSSHKDYETLFSGLQEGGSKYLNQLGFDFEASMLASISAYLKNTATKNGELPQTNLSEMQILEMSKGTMKGFSSHLYTEDKEPGKLYLNLNSKEHIKDDKVTYIGPVVNHIDQRNKSGGQVYPSLTKLAFIANALPSSEKLQKSPSLIERLAQKFEDGEYPQPGYPNEKETVYRMINDSLQFSKLKKINEQGKEVSLEWQDIEMYGYRKKQDGKEGVSMQLKTNIPLSRDSVIKLEEYIKQPLEERVQKILSDFQSTTNLKNSSSRKLGSYGDNKEVEMRDSAGRVVVDKKMWDLAILRHNTLLKMQDERININESDRACANNDYIHGKSEVYYNAGIKNIRDEYSRLIAEGKIFASYTSFPRIELCKEMCQEIDTICQNKDLGQSKVEFARYLTDCQYPIFAAYYQQTKDSSNIPTSAFIDDLSRGMTDPTRGRAGNTLIVPYSAMGDDGNTYYAFQKYTLSKNPDGGLNTVKRTFKGNSFQGHYLVTRDLDQEQMAQNSVERPTVILAEGLSTAIAIGAALDDKSAKDNGVMIISYGSSANLEKAFERVANIYPQANFVMAADNDFGLVVSQINRFLDKEFGGKEASEHNTTSIKSLKNPNTDQGFSQSLKDVLQANTGFKGVQDLMGKADDILQEKLEGETLTRGKLGVIAPNSHIPVSKVNLGCDKVTALSLDMQHGLMGQIKTGNIPLNRLVMVANSEFANTDFDDLMKHKLRGSVVNLEREDRSNAQVLEEVKCKAWSEYASFVTEGIDKAVGVQVSPSTANTNNYVRAPVRLRSARSPDEIRQHGKALKSTQNKAVALGASKDLEGGFNGLFDKLQGSWGGDPGMYHQTVLSLHGMGLTHDEQQAIAIREDDLRPLVIKSLLLAASEPNSPADQIYRPLMQEIIKDSQRSTPSLTKDGLESEQWLSIAKTYQLVSDLRSAGMNKEGALFSGGICLSPMLNGRPQFEMVKASSFGLQDRYQSLSPESQQAIVASSIVQGLIKANVGQEQISSNANEMVSAKNIAETLKDAVVQHENTPKLVQSALSAIHYMAEAGVYTNRDISDGFYQKLGQNAFNPKVNEAGCKETLVLSFAAAGINTEMCEDRLLNDNKVNNTQMYKVGMNTPAVIRKFDNEYEIGGRVFKTSNLLGEMDRWRQNASRAFDSLIQKQGIEGDHTAIFTNILDNHSFKRYDDSHQNQARTRSHDQSKVSDAEMTRKQDELVVQGVQKTQAACDVGPTMG